MLLTLNNVHTQLFYTLTVFFFFQTVRRVLDVIRTQICTIALSFTLFNLVRLPREAFKYGDIPYLVIYSFWLLVVALPTTLLQLAMGQLSQQDAIGVWRAVPILRGNVKCYNLLMYWFIRVMANARWGLHWAASFDTIMTDRYL